ncbi:MAG: NADP-reducing hydrogenase subunit HndC [Syntrophus sp. PtaU1.Bin208]|nr:MAG: NADP-reducing hydrogenase subunit HndC [Syntrophus sp. PtaU1.Bin208]
MSADASFKPKMLGIICNWCCYGGADLCGVSRFQYPTFIRLIRVMCSGRVDLKFIFRAFLTGQDAVFVGGCHINDCHYNPEGNYDAYSMVTLCKKLLEHIGINPKRLRLEWVSAGEGIRFAQIMNEFSREIQELGPLGSSEGIDEAELKSRLEEMAKLIPYFKLAKMKELALHDHDETAYEKLFPTEEVERLIREAPSYYIDPEKCQACMTCARKCPVDAIISAKGQVHVVDQDKCIKCGTCFAACPPKFGAVTKLVGVPVPPPFPEGQRTVIRKGKEQTP